MKIVSLELTVEEVNGILAVLAELPTKTGAWPLFNKIQQIAQKQLEQNQEASGANNDDPV